MSKTNQAIITSARRLLRTSLEFPVGATKPKSSNVRRGPQEQLLAWMDLERWLQQQIYMYSDSSQRIQLQNSNAAMKRLKVDSSANEEEELQEKIMQTRDELFSIQQTRSSEELFLKRVRENQVLVSTLMSDAGTEGPEHRKIQHAVEQRDEKVKQALQLTEEIKKVRDNRLGMEEEARSLKNETRELYTRLRSVQEASTNLDMFGDSREKSGILGDIEQERIKNSILRRVLQALVIESGVDWAKNTDLIEFMTRLG